MDSNALIVKKAAMQKSAFRTAADVCDEHGFRIGAKSGLHKVAAQLREGVPLNKALRSIYTKMSEEKRLKLAKILTKETVERCKAAMGSGCGSKKMKTKKTKKK